jgi:hypothetical protein
VDDERRSVQRVGRDNVRGGMRASRIAVGLVLVPLSAAGSVTVGCGGRVELVEVGDAAPDDGAPGSDPWKDAEPSDSAVRVIVSPEDSGQDVGPVTFPDAGLLAHCQTGGNVLFVDGDPGEITHAGPLTFGPDAGAWSAEFIGPNGAEVHLWPNDMSWGDTWTVYLEAPQGMTLTTQRYDNTVGIFTVDPAAPTLYVAGGWEQCATTTGWFEIEQLKLPPPSGSPGTSYTLNAITAAFEEHCNGETAALHGCLHYEQP